MKMLSDFIPKKYIFQVFKVANIKHERGNVNLFFFQKSTMAKYAVIKFITCKGEENQSNFQRRAFEKRQQKPFSWKSIHIF